MQVARYYNNKDVRLEQMPVPAIGEEEMLVRIMASGICGSDVMEWYRMPKAPLILGHEIAGEISKVGKSIENFRAGERVVVSHHVPCMKCRWCQKNHPTVCETLRTTHLDPGGFAQFARVPALQVAHGIFRLPNSLSFEEGTFVEPIGCALRGQKLARMTPGSCVAVIGTGVAGLLNISVARANGASRLIAADLNESRLKKALEIGADWAFPSDLKFPGHLKEINEGYLADLVILATAAPSAIDLAIRCVDRGGTILFFAPPQQGQNFSIPLYDLWKDNIATVSSYAASPSDMQEAIGLLEKKQVKISTLISHCIPLSEASQGFSMVAEASNCLKVILLPHAANGTK